MGQKPTTTNEGVSDGLMATGASAEAPTPEFASANGTPARAQGRADQALRASQASRVDRGRLIALGVMGALVALGLGLVARGPRAGGSSETPVVANKDAESTYSPVDTAVDASVGAGVVPDASEVGSDGASARDGGEAPTADASVPVRQRVWRVADLDTNSGQAPSDGRANIEIKTVKLPNAKRSLVSALASAGVAVPQAKTLLRALDAALAPTKIESASGSPIEFAPSHAQASLVFARDRSTGSAIALEYVASPTEIWQAKLDDAWTFRKLALYIETKPRELALAVTNDLAQSASLAGLPHSAIESIDDALAPYADRVTLRTGVRLRVAARELWVEDALTRFDVEAIEVVPKVGSSHRFYFYDRARVAADEKLSAVARRRSPVPGFYDAKGQQPVRGVLRSPVPLARITSRFNPRRLHPVLHRVVPHNGVDFGASTGTPVYASAEGTVSSVGDSGPCGNMVQIEHARGLTTAYCHLSRFAPGLHHGQHVEAKQLIGYVGQTGRATGPHLHFAVKRGGAFIDPMALKIDGFRTLPQVDREWFAKRRGDLDAVLERIALPPLDAAAANAPEDKDEPAGEE